MVLYSNPTSRIQDPRALAAVLAFVLAGDPSLRALPLAGALAGVAVRLARALGVPLESLTRAPTDASTCAACGARRTP